MATSDDSKIDLNNFDTHIMTPRKTALKHHIIKWTLECYSQLPIGIEIESCPIKPFPFIEWNLIFKKESNDRRLLLLNKENDVETEIELSLGDLNGRRLYHNIGTKRNFIKGTKTDILARTDNIVTELNNLFDDTLILLCNFRIDSKPNLEALEIESEPLLVCGRDKLLEDLKIMYDTHQYADLTLIVGEEQFRVHKSILCARSPVFQRMFQHGMGENESNRIQIDDVDLPEMKKLVDFLYSGVYKDEKDADKAYALYYVADKYEMLDLRMMCSKTMLRKLTVDNAIQELIRADRHNDEYMKGKIINFFMQNFIAITDMDAWDAFISSETKLALEMIKLYAKKLKD